MLLTFLLTLICKFPKKSIPTDANGDLCSLIRNDGRGPICCFSKLRLLVLQKTHFDAIRFKSSLAPPINIPKFAIFAMTTLYTWCSSFRWWYDANKYTSGCSFGNSIGCLFSSHKVVFSSRPFARIMPSPSTTGSSLKNLCLVPFRSNRKLAWQIKNKVFSAALRSSGVWCSGIRNEFELNACFIY